MLEPLRKDARIGSEGYGNKGVTALRLARVTVKLLFHKSMKQSLHYFVLGLSVFVYRTFQCEMLELLFLSAGFHVSTATCYRLV